MNKFNLSAAEIEQRSRPRLALVVPCYNEEGVLQTTIAELNRRLDALIADASCASDSYIVFVDDGSKDETWPIIAAAVAAAPARVVGVRLARKSGHQYALVAGLAYVTDRSDASISIDADLQDDLDVLQEMVARYRDGAELVLGIRRSRATDSWFKRTSAAAFYKLLGLLGVDIVEQHADFRLLSAAAMGNLRQFPEYHLFLRGFPNLLHNRVDYVHYDRHARTAGQSKYPIARMLALALDGITSAAPHQHSRLPRLLRRDPPGDLRAGRARRRRGAARLGLHHGAAVRHGRHDHALGRYRRGICRQDLYGSEAPPALPRRPCGGRR
jgi:glycosyltransferase involved in cell wall biosynthesis